MIKMPDYTAILQSMNPDEASELAAFVKTFPLEIIREKDTGMIMMEAVDCFGNPFYIGEVLATAVEVEYQSVRGYGMLIGSDGNKPFVLAALDAAYRAKDENLLGQLTKVLEDKKDEIVKKLKKEKIFTESTKVQFGLMVEG
jgi:phosphonate C-P lyase system protein PhnG